MTRTKVAFTEGKLRSLGACINNEGVIHINSMSSHYSIDTFPILLFNDPLSYIWMQHIHNEDHTGITTTVAKSRRKYWIARGRKLAEKIK